MECPHFAGVYMKYCVAEREVYVPSISEMREHCRHLQHRLCRHYLRTDNSLAQTGTAPVYRDSARTME